jgi:hypothetical protein
MHGSEDDTYRYVVGGAVDLELGFGIIVARYPLYGGTGYSTAAQSHGPWCAYCAKERFLLTLSAPASACNHTHAFSQV